jgi:plastocyanin
MKPTLFLIFYLISTISYAVNISGKVDVRKLGGVKSLPNHEDAIVYLTGLNDNSDPKSIEFNQINKQFSPRLLPVIQGQTVQFWNRDRVQHNVFSTDSRKQFDLGRYSSGNFKSVVYDELGNYKVYCNIHRTMIADIVVVPNQFFAKTDKQGHYFIRDVPSGKYKLKTWHIYGGSSERDIVIGVKNLREDFTLVSTKVIREIEEHKNKQGLDYQSPDSYGYDDNSY